MHMDLVVPKVPFQVAVERAHDFRGLCNGCDISLPENLVAYVLVCFGKLEDNWVTRSLSTDVVTSIDDLE